MEKIEPLLGRKGRQWTARATLPGGDFSPASFESEVTRLQDDYPFISERHARRLFGLYGTRARALLGEAASMADLGHLFGGDLYEAEVRYLMAEEWAVEADDILWRRTKCGLRLTHEQANDLARYMAGHSAVEMPVRP